MNDPKNKGLLQRRAIAPLAAMAALGRAAASSQDARSSPAGEAAATPLIDMAFGAAGDGVTDDTAAILAAFRSGKPFRFGPGTYVYNGSYRITVPAVQASGVPNRTRLVRRGAAPVESYAGLLFEAATVVLDGIIFDGGGATFPGNPWNVVVREPATVVEITHCRFTEARGALGIGLGLFGSPQAQPQSHLIDDCEFDHCDRAGLMLSQIAAGQFTRNRAHDVSVDGITVSTFGATDYQAAHPYAGQMRTERLVIAENLAWNCGQTGISVTSGRPANYKDPHHEGGWPLYSAPAHPDAFRITVRDNYAWDCGSYAMAISGDYMNVEGNILGRINGCPAAINTSGNASGMFGCLLGGGTRWSRIVGNSAIGYDTNGARSVPWGFDMGFGGFWSIVEGNVLVGINGAALNIGGTIGLTARNNTCYDCSIGIAVQNLESDSTPGGMGDVFARGFWIDSNRCFLSRGQIGIITWDNAQGAIRGNDCVDHDGAADPMRAIAVIGGAVELSDNSWNGSHRWPAALNASRELIVPDGADEVVVVAPPGTVLSGVLTHSTADVRDGIGWVTMTSPGSGYTVSETHMTVDDAGHRATAAELEPWIWNGGVIGARVTRRGAGYNPAAAGLTVRGDGRGATGVVQVGTPIPRAKSLRLIFLEGGGFAGVSVGPRGVIGLTEVNGFWSVTGHS